MDWGTAVRDASQGGGHVDVRFYDVGDIDEKRMIYAVIAARYGGKWVFVKHQARTTWEIPGGRKEPREAIFQTAKRELFEETGALDYKLKEVCDYSVTRDETSYGRLFFAEVSDLGPLPESEIAEIVLSETLPPELTYPEIQPLLLKRASESLGEIVEVTEDNFFDWVELGLLLWPDHSRDDLRESFLDLFHSKKETAFLYREAWEHVGFISVSIRVDYVEGSDSSPVGFVEGIYVKESHRQQGIAKKLLQRGEEWVLSQGCTQMGSDIEQDNKASYDFHRSVGFREANRIICFIKNIR